MGGNRFAIPIYCRTRLTKIRTIGPPWYRGAGTRPQSAARWRIWMVLSAVLASSAREITREHSFDQGDLGNFTVHKPGAALPTQRTRSNTATNKKRCRNEQRGLFQDAAQRTTLEKDIEQ